jgi:cysteinyl-tRNA synthetase
LIIWFFVLKRYNRQLKYQNEQMARSRAHWDAVESKLDQLIELCKQQNRSE